MAYQINVRQYAYDSEGNETDCKIVRERWETLSHIYRWYHYDKGVTLAFSVFGDILEIDMDVKELDILKQQCRDRENKEMVLFSKDS